MDNNVWQSILKTVLYSDIFDYPLSKDQLWQFLISSKKIQEKDFEKVLDNLKKPVAFKNGWYYILGREEVLKKRERREEVGRKKLLTAKKIARLLSFVPLVKFIGVSGGLSMSNTEKEDDIDIFVIAKGNNIWLTRFSLVLFLKLLGKHRSRLDKKVEDKICLNMIMDERFLSLEKERRSLYAAHEIAQLTPLYNREHTYEIFVNNNSWVLKFMPNTFSIMSTKELKVKNKKQLFAIRYSLFVIEFIARQIQLWYIRKHKTSEKISNQVLAFHPFDYRKAVEENFSKRLKKYEKDF